MKILINVPDLSLLGGVANHYKGLKAYWQEDVRYNIIGRRKRVPLPGYCWLPYDVICFITHLMIWQPDVVVLNPSLANSAVKRDSVFLKISSLLGFSTAVFFHGWNKEYAAAHNKRKFVKLYNRARVILVLATEFKNELQEWGITTRIELTTTKIDDSLIKGTKVSRTLQTDGTILFLARIEKNKGIYTILDTFKLLKKEYPMLKLRIVGGGDELIAAKNYSQNLSLKDVEFTGNLDGERLINEFLNAMLYVLPTVHGEGMPTSVLEAMAFGLPIVTRPVGGIVDFFEEGKMGYSIQSTEPIDFVIGIKKCISESTKYKEICSFNENYARNNFMASIVTQKLQSVFREIK